MSIIKLAVVLQVGQRLLQLDVITESLSKQVMEHHEEMGMSCIFVFFLL